MHSVEISTCSGTDPLKLLIMRLRLWYGNSPIEATATTEMPEVQQVSKGFLAGVSSYFFQPIPSAKQTNK